MSRASNEKMTQTEARPEPSASRAWGAVAFFVASGAYSGRFPIAPGTAGSLVGVALGLALRWTRSPVVYGVVMAAVALLGWAAAGAVERQLGKKDPSVVVVDEVAGMMLSICFIPLTVLGLIFGFVVFRLLDVIKPFPCRRAESLSGGLGIMADDLIAGLYTNGILRLTIALWPALGIS